MKFQQTKSSCGAAALANALEALGIHRSEEELAALCGTTAEGTDAKGLRKALSKIDGTINSIIEESKPDVALLRLLQALYEGRPVVLCVDNWDHWAVAVGVLGFGKRVVCVDSGAAELVVVRTIDEVVAWWQCEGAKKGLYGVVV